MTGDNKILRFLENTFLLLVAGYSIVAGGVSWVIEKLRETRRAKNPPNHNGSGDFS